MSRKESDSSKIYDKKMKFGHSFHEFDHKSYEKPEYKPDGRPPNKSG